MKTHLTLIIKISIEKGIIFLFLMMLCIRAEAQLSLISDNFNDGDITANPVWSGGTNGYTLTSTSPLEGAFSLTNTTSGSVPTIATQYGTNTNLSAANYNYTLLYRDNGTADPSTLNPWEDFSSNSITHWRFYLAANSTNPNTATGVYLSHSGNALRLVYRGGSGNGWEVARYTISRNVTYSIKVVAKPNGNWELYVDEGTGEATTLRGNQWPNLFRNGSQNIYMIFQSNATIGNGGRFNWDNAGLFSKSLTILQLTNGVHTGELEQGMTEKALIGFSATAVGSVILESVLINSSVAHSVLSNYKLYTSVDNDYATTGDNTLLTGLSFSASGGGTRISNINQTIDNTTAHYFFVADIPSTNTPAAVRLSMSCTNCGAANTNMVTNNAERVNNYSFSGTNYIITRVLTWQHTTSFNDYRNDWDNWNAWSADAPTENDVVIFSKGGYATPRNIPANARVKRIVIDGGTTVDFTNISMTTGRTITITGGTSDDLEITAGSAMNITATNYNLGISLSAGATASISGSVIFSGFGHTLTAASAGAVTFQSGSSFTGGTGLTGNAFGSTTSGSVVFAAGSTLEDQVGLDYFTANNVISLQSGSNYRHSTATTPSIAGKTFGNIILNSGATFAVGANTHTVNGSITGAGTLTLSSGTLNVSGDFSSTGTFTCTSCIINLNGSTQAVRGGNYATLNISGSGTKTASGNITVSTLLTTASGTTLNIGTNTLGGSLTTITNNGTIATSNTSSTPLPNGRTWGGTVQYAAASGAQTVVNGTYNNLTLTNTSGTSTTNGNIVVNGVLSNGTGTFNLAANTLSGTLSSITNNGTVETFSSSSTPLPTGKTWGGTIRYAAAAGAQTIVSGTYNNLTLSANSGTNTAGGSITVNGTLTNGAGIFNLSTFTLAGTLNTISNSGTISTSNTSTTPLASGKVWNGTVRYAVSGGGQTIASGTYENLTLSAASGTNTANGNITVNGTLTNGAGTFTLSTFTLDGSLSSIANTGIISTASVSSTPFTSGKTWNGTIRFAGSAAQTIVAGTYNNLELMNSTGATMSGDVTVGGALTLNSGKLAIGSNTLYLNGTASALSVSNSITGSANSNISIGGSGVLGTLYFDQSIKGSSNLVKDLTINRANLSGTVTLGNELRLAGTLTPTAGTFYTNDTLVIVSAATGSGRIGAINPANFALIGKVAVERYFTAKTSRRWSFVSAAVSGETFKRSWQDSIFITGAGTGGTICAADSTKYNSNGFDASSSSSPSLFYYDQVTTAKWISVPSTDSVIKKATGYRLLVRGNRTVANACTDQLNSANPPAPTATIITSKGTLNIGDIPVTVSAKTTGTYGYSLIGNPYASEINFTSLYNDNSSVISNKYWTYDPGTSSTNYLVYSMGVVAGNNPTNTINTANATRIASGQAFFVESINGGTVTFKESHKTTSTQVGVFRTNSVNRLVRTALEKQDGTFIDNMVVRFSDDASVSLAESRTWDAATLNSGNFIASIKGTRSFAIQTRPLDFYNDTVAVRVVSAATGNFKLSFSEFETFTEANQIILLDLYTGTATDVKQNQSYNFSITSDAATQGSGRFKLVFRSSASVLPLSFLTVNAAAREGSVAINWQLAFEQEVLQYYIERSEDGRSFHVIGSTSSKGNSSQSVDYSFTDRQPLTGNSYYRIKAVEKDGTIKYSSIVLVNSISNTVTLNVYPNPVKDVLNLQLPLSNTIKELQLRNSFGSVVISNKQNSSKSTVNISHLPAGMYYYTVVDSKGEVYKGKIVKQ